MTKNLVGLIYIIRKKETENKEDVRVKPERVLYGFSDNEMLTALSKKFKRSLKEYVERFID